LIWSRRWFSQPNKDRSGCPPTAIDGRGLLLTEGLDEATRLDVRDPQQVREVVALA
jgi:hypothetical protein